MPSNTDFRFNAEYHRYVPDHSRLFALLQGASVGQGEGDGESGGLTWRSRQSQRPAPRPLPRVVQPNLVSPREHSAKGNPMLEELDAQVDSATNKFEVDDDYIVDTSGTMWGQRGGLNAFMQFYHGLMGSEDALGFNQRLLMSFWSVNGNVGSRSILQQQLMRGDEFAMLERLPVFGGIERGDVTIGGGTPWAKALIARAMRQAARAAFFGGVGGLGIAIRQAGGGVADGLDDGDTPPEAVAYVRSYFRSLFRDIEETKPLFLPDKLGRDFEYAFFCGERYDWRHFQRWHIKAGFPEANVRNLGTIQGEDLAQALMAQAKSASELQG